MLRYIIIALILHSSMLTMAQNTQELTLEDCISIACDSSLQSFIDKNLFLSSHWEFKTYKAERLPLLSLNLTPIQYNRDFTERYDSDLNQDVYRQQQSLYSSGNVTLSQNVDATGGTFYVDSELGYLKNYGGTDYTQFNTVPIRVGYYQSLFGYNSFKWEKKIEPLKYEIAKMEYIYSREELSETVISLFFSLAMAQTEYDMAVENLASSDTLYQIGVKRFEIAAISQEDMLTLRLDALNAKNTLKNAAVDLEEADNALKSYLNLDKSKQTKLSLPERPINILVPKDKAIALAQENNPEYLNNQQIILESESALDQAKREALFDANLSLSVGFNQVSSDFRTAYKDPLQQDVVSISLSVPILDWGVRKGELNVAKSNLNVSKITAQQSEQDLEQELLITIQNFNIQQDLINSAEEALDLAVQVYDISKKRFITGQSDLSSLTLALNRQSEAQVNYISSLNAYWESYYKLRKLTLYDFEKQVDLSAQFDQMIEIK